MDCGMWGNWWVIVLWVVGGGKVWPGEEGCCAGWVGGW